MNDYFEGTISQLRERCNCLIGMIPVGLPREFHLLEQISRSEINEVSRKLQELLVEKDWLKPENQGERLRRFKQLVRDIDILESVCVAALERQNDNDLYLNKLVEIIRQEIAYPLPPLVVTSLSKSESYFETWTKYRLMLVPLSESRFLLHLPDIYHELGHPLLEERNDPRVRPFQNKLLEVINEAMSYIEDETEKSEKRNEPLIILDYWELWSRCWIHWAKEFFCYLFAVYVLGPAFAWSHLHLAATRGADPFQVPLVGTVSRHPPDAARMEAILESLTLAGFGTEAAEIEQKWKTFLNIAQPKRNPEYRKCLPPRLIKFVAEKVFEGVQDINCRVVTPDTSDVIHDLFNEAWREFWRSRGTYVKWEAEKIKILRITSSS